MESPAPSISLVEGLAVPGADLALQRIQGDQPSPRSRLPKHGEYCPGSFCVYLCKGHCKTNTFCRHVRKKGGWRVEFDPLSAKCLNEQVGFKSRFTTPNIGEKPPKNTNFFDEWPGVKA